MRLDRVMYCYCSIKMENVVSQHYSPLNGVVTEEDLYPYEKEDQRVHTQISKFTVVQTA